MAKSHFQELKPSSAIIITMDLIAIFATFLITATLIILLVPDNSLTLLKFSFYMHLIVLLPTLQLTTLAVGLYNEKLRETFRGIATRIFVSSSLAYLLSFVFYKLTVFNELPYFFKELFYALAFLSLIATRFIASKTPYKQVGMKRVLILGSGTRASIIEKCMRRKTDRVGIDIVGFVPMKGDATQGVSTARFLEYGDSLEQYVLDKEIDEIVIAADERRDVLPNQALFNCKRFGTKITDIIDFVERETGQVAVTHIYPSWIIYGHSNSSGSLYRSFDWFFNTTIAIFIFLLTWPLMLITVLAIKMEEGLSAPVLYSQKRTGLNGVLFDIYKFRSMRTDAEVDGAKWAQKSDPRVTRVGNIIRKYRIDELPQLFNVIRGEMGFVGPRPERPQFIEEFEESIPYYNHRLNVKPGLTGWAQLKYPYGSSHDDAVEKLKFDLYYIKYRGFLFDLLILLRTAEIVLFGKGR